MVDSFNNFIKTIIAIKDSTGILLAFLLIPVLVIFEIIPLPKIDDPNYLLVFNTGVIVILCMSLGLLIDHFCKWIIKKYKLSDFYWNRVLTKEQLSFFRKVFLYKSEFILVEDPDDLPEEYRNDEIRELDRNICEELVGVKILKSLGSSTKEIDYDRNIYETSEKYIINCENENATLLKEKFVMENQKRLLKDKKIKKNICPTEINPLNDDQYWLNYFTDWQLDFLTDCITVKFISNGEWNAFPDSVTKSVETLETLEVIRLDYDECYHRYFIHLNDKLDNKFKLLKPYLKNRLIKKNVQTDTK